MDDPTRTSAPPAGRPAVTPAGESRFVPGSVIAGRFRVAGLIGRGGMGHVYKADDLKLGQTVALKFLPEQLARDGAALDRFHNEVRIARQISHPNVCRVFDIGEVDGQPFLTMEFIDGEDLASLMRRIGRLPHDKALEVARQLCAGLAAAHDLGMLHRDLKPANVMLDGRGRAKITDFGLAGLESGIARGDVGSGTPAYMAPEQLAGREVTRQSDLYALGLVLYEVFTGRRVFDAPTLPELRRLRDSTTPTRPSHWVPELDSLTEGVILKCLETDARERPSSALAVAAMLPGGNPMEAALRAGETPSPEMLAASPVEGALSTRMAGGAFALVLTLLAALVAGDRVNLHAVARLDRSPVVLDDRAVAIIGELGYPTSAADAASGWQADESWMAWPDDPLKGSARWQRIAAGRPVTFVHWYRQSPRPLLPRSPIDGLLSVQIDEPPLTVPGMVRVVLDPRGRLVEFRAVPAATLGAAGTEPDWSAVFRAAGLEPAAFAPATPLETPPTFVDHLRAWTGALPEHPDLAVRVEAAAAFGRVVSFRVTGPWDTAAESGAANASGSVIAVMMLAGASALIVCAGAVLARRNLRSGRGDLAGARKLMVFAAIVETANGLIGSEYPATFDGITALAITIAKMALLSAAVNGVLYLALEPFVRATRPVLLVAWNRVLAGRFRDPMVARDVLFGAVLALIGAAAFMLSGWVKLWTDSPYPPNHSIDLAGLGSISGSVQLVLQTINPMLGLGALVFLALTRRLIRHDWTNIAFVSALVTVGFVLFAARSWPTVLASAIWISLSVIASARLGLIAGISFFVFFALTMRSPFVTDFTSWQADAVIFRLVFMVSVAGLAAWWAAGSQGTRPAR